VQGLWTVSKIKGDKEGESVQVIMV